jgi:hypothetical protein
MMQHVRYLRMQGCNDAKIGPIDSMSRTLAAAKTEDFDAVNYLTSLSHFEQDDLSVGTSAHYPLGDLA